VQAIQERIKAIDLEDCKVRISNVDSQASYDNIVIQVIGEMSTKGEEPKKFVQTFVLAQQPSGYFVLNDILRYVKDEEEPAEAEAEQETIAEQKVAVALPELHANPEAPKSDVGVEEKPLDAAVVDKKLEEVGGATKGTPATSTANTPAEPAVSAPEVAKKPEAEPEPAVDPEKAAQEVAEEETTKAEEPKEPIPTPVAPRAASRPAEPEQPKEAPKPFTWASMAAAAAGPKPAVTAAVKPVTPAVPQTRAPEPTRAAAATPAEPTTPKEAGSEWQTAGADSKRQNRPQQTSAAAQKDEGTLGYVKFVTEKVSEKDLRATLASFGDLVYFDINRTKVSRPTSAG
jgi:hypothetical protein